MPWSNCMSDPLWTPSQDQIENSNLSGFIEFMAQNYEKTFQNYDELYHFSILDTENFWKAVWQYGNVYGDMGDAPYLINGDKMPGGQFFPNARLNFAQNLIKKNDGTDAVVFWGEDKVKKCLSWAELNQTVSKLQQAFKQSGVSVGDRICAMMPNMPETVISMLATTSIGATWSSCSPDFGVKGVFDRFGQVEPKVFIACDGYYYNGKTFSVKDKIKEVVAQMPSVETVIIVPYLGEAAEVAAEIDKAVDLESYISSYTAQDIEYEQLPFNHPLYILFSSGTTGVPKCIVHSAGGTLLQHIKEIKLHSDVKPNDKLFYFTTCGWMMWNWLVSGLACEATLLLYDGSPFAPNGNILFDYADAEGMTFFGTSAKYIDAVKKEGLVPKLSHNLSTLRAMASTGSPLSAESFDFVYEGIKSDIQLASIAGGTDIVSCFVLGNPTKPVYRGEIQGPGLGLAVDVFDDDGKHMPSGKGELVCKKPFPAMPIGFWNDADGKRYSGSYFEHFENIWHHGDFAEWTENGGIIIHGRSDATLNPGGVRIGTAEIYRQVEQLDEVKESIVIGQDWDNDVRVVLFVILQEGQTLGEELAKAIKTKIRTGASPRHVPAVIVQVTDIPRTKSGKITELAVRDVVAGREIKNKEALANPEALELYKNLPELS